MKASRLTTTALLAAALAACAGPQARIRKHQAEFASYPPEIQRKIRAGEVDVGFTDRQAALALGRPDRVYDRKTAAARQEVWAYGVGSGEPHVGIGMGFGMGGPGFYGGGVGIAADPDVDRGWRLRVVFQDGVVVSVDRRE